MLKQLIKKIIEKIDYKRWISIKDDICILETILENYEISLVYIYNRHIDAYGYAICENQEISFALYCTGDAYYCQTIYNAMYKKYEELHKEYYG